jgi:heme exporter protein B
MWRDLRLIAAKDLRIEARSRVVTNQILPFALLILVLFAFAIDPDRGILARVTGGLFWIAVLLASVLAVQRSFGLEATDGNRDGLRLTGIEPAAIFLGKAAAIFLQLLALEAVLLVGVAVLYTADLGEPLLLLASSVAATAGLAAAGSLYGVLAAGLRVRETLLPLLLLPVVAPVLIGATQAYESALVGTPGEGWPWTGLLVVFAAIYTVFGILAFGPLLEEA